MINEEAEYPKKVKFIFKKPDDYNIIYANGVYGGITPRGDILMHFFFEHRDFPVEEEVNIEMGQIKPDDSIKVFDDDFTMNRDMKVGIIMSPNQVDALVKWLIEKVAETKSKYEQMET
jgi:hypothetical protein